MKILRDKPIEAGVFRGSALGIAVTVHFTPIISVFEAAMFIAQLAASQLMQINDSYFMSSITLVVRSVSVLANTVETPLSMSL